MIKHDHSMKLLFFLYVFICIDQSQDHAAPLLVGYCDFIPLFMIIHVYKVNVAVGIGKDILNITVNNIHTYSKGAEASNLPIRLIQFEVIPHRHWCLKLNT